MTGVRLNICIKYCLSSQRISLYPLYTGCDALDIEQKYYAYFPSTCLLKEPLRSESKKP